jgi:biopolymer transport protein ExbD
MKTFKRGASRHTEINITSLIDVSFMLVIFFMIGSTFEKPALSVSLPSASSGEAVRRQLLTVTLDSDGLLYLDGERIGKESLGTTLLAYSRENPELRVALDCDGQLAFQKVVEVMDILTASEVRNVAIRHELPR